METEKMEEIEKPKSSYNEGGGEKILRTLEKESSSKLLGGSNENFFVKLKGNGSGIFKPEYGENSSLRNWAGGALYKRERAAYLVDRFLNFGLVPPTVIKEIDKSIGSLQEFINDAKTTSDVDKSQHASEMKKLWVFDFIIWNADRNENNLLFDKNEQRVYAIDNGIAFCKSSFYPNEEFYDQSIPEEFMEKIRSFFSSEDKKSILRDLLKELLPEEEVGTCFNRIELLNTRGVITREDVRRLEKEYKEQKHRREEI